MIEYIRGILDELSPTSAIVEAGGVGYEMLISLNTYTALQGKREVRLFAYEVIREDAHLLYGFATKSERQLFDLLIGISGIGGQTARMVLSAFTPSEFADIIRSEDVKMIKSVKGIGPKAAQRIVVELKDKMALDFGTADATTQKTGETLTSASRERMEEAVAALTMLGFPPAAGSKVVRQIVKDQPDCPVEQIIKQALKLL
ncbi:MAG: Holliday junction branch migration protein RuvA [Alloprevotella sp.]